MKGFIIQNGRINAMTMLSFRLQQQQQPQQRRPTALLLLYRCFSKSSSSGTSTTTSSSFTVSIPSAATTTSWERSAAMVKSTTTNTMKNHKYMNAIRESHDPALHVKTLEDEIRGTMGKALGKQGDKILHAMRLMQSERNVYDELWKERIILVEKEEQQQQQEKATPTTTITCDDDKKMEWSKKVLECVERHNQYRKEAITARWELMVHRQAVGFIVNNHNIVHETFPIGDALPLTIIHHDDDDDDEKAEHIKNGVGDTISTTSKTEMDSKELRGQLDWWQQVGRWR